MTSRLTAAFPSIALVIGLGLLSACGGDRDAEAETPVSEAEVSTELPESVVSDNQLQATANAAAQVAATPPPEVVVVPVPTGQAGAQKGSSQGSAPAQAGTATNNQQKSR